MGVAVLMRIGLIARSDNTGLGSQTHELASMLNPDRIMLVNSFPFNKNKQHPDRYDHFRDVQYSSGGFLGRETVARFIKRLDVVITCETFYCPQFIQIANKMGVKTVLQYNYEFLDYLQNDSLTLPNMLLAPSVWNLEDVKNKFGDKTKVEFLPPPTNEDNFKNARAVNMSKDHKRILHVAGKIADHDRNGTQTVIKMLQHSKEDYELVIKSQSEVPTTYKDSRLKIEQDNPKDRESLYKGFDAMILPRRYAGLCLPMNEALMSGLPVFMTDVSPNNHFLPQDWLVESKKISEFMTRTMIDIHEADAEILAKKIDNYIAKDKVEDKKRAYEIGYNNFSPNVLKDKYINLISSM